MIHDDLVEFSGGPHAPLSEAKRPEFESAVAKPRNLAHYEGADLVTQAVALMVGISQCQSFVDGNKRAAFGSGDVFLRINGLWLHAPREEIADWLIGIAAETDKRARSELVEQFDAWIRGWIRPTTNPEQTE